MESNTNSIITVLEVLRSYERLNLSTKLRLDVNKFHSGLIEVLADNGEKIDFSSDDYKGSIIYFTEGRSPSRQKWEFFIYQVS